MAKPTIFRWFKLVLDEIPLKDIGAAALKTYLLLASRQDSTGCVSMSYSAIAEEVGFSRRTIIEAVKELEELDLIEKIATKNPRAPLVARILHGASVGKGDPANRVNHHNKTEE